MIRIKNLTIKNFMSVGAVSQAVDFVKTELVLILGENLDLGGDDAGSKNGVGKSSLMSALSYALYGQALVNIKKENLINITNGKAMLVTCEFEANGNLYRIERGRRPNVLKFYVNNIEQKEANSDSQGDSRETQQDIEKCIGMSHDMFKHIVALNTYTEPFLSLRANDQRIIIEQLLGITLLSEKAESLKEEIKQTKDAITKEELTISAITEANKRIEDQIKSLLQRKSLWERKKVDSIEQLDKAIAELSGLNIECELETHKKLEIYNAKEFALKTSNEQFKKLSKELLREQKQLKEVSEEIESLKNDVCHACGQKVHSKRSKELLTEKKVKHDSIVQAIQKITSESDSISEKITALGILGEKPETFYESIADAYDHKNQIALLIQQKVQKEQEQDTYTEQIQNMQSQALQTISYDKINELTQLMEHQDFLLKLLTNKDSFIRKKIIDQNLNYLNYRLAQYLTKMGLPHNVVFQNDLSVAIEELGRPLDFDNLSRGERTRLILSLSWAFRDVWENLYSPINLLFVDELVDSGMDPAGVENTIAIFKDMARNRNKSVWLISHKEELQTRVNHTMKVVKENGFTYFQTEE